MASLKYYNKNTNQWEYVISNSDIVETDPTVPAWAKEPNKPSYTKSDVGLGNVDNVKQYSADNPPPYPVTSVNGKTGAINISASDVGALPDTTVIPTVPTKISAFTNDAGYLTEHQSLEGYATESYVNSQISAIPTPDVSGQIGTHNVATDSHNDIRVLINELTTRLNTLANSDDTTLDQMSEVVAYIKNNKSLIDGITTSKVNVSDIINNLTTNVNNKPLSAAQGVALKALIDAITIPTNVSAFTNDAGYLTEHQSLEGLATETYVDAQITEAIDDIDIEIDEISVQLGTDGTVGGYKTGDVIAAGTDIKTILNKLFQKSVPATYTSPKIALSAQSTAAGSYEYGTNITAQVKATFTKNDAGALESIAILKDGTEILNGTSSPLTSTAEEIQLTTTVSYTASATYAEGAIKNNNLGEASPDGHIVAGTVTSSAVKFTPYRQGYFYGVLATDKTVPLTSDIIRGCTKKNGSYAAGNLPLISASSVNNRKRIFVACPATNVGVTKVVMPSAQGADATKDFVKQSSTVTVEGANGATGIAYNIWVYEPAFISDDQTFTVTLG